MYQPYKRGSGGMVTLTIKVHPAFAAALKERASEETEVVRAKHDEQRLPGLRAQAKPRVSQGGILTTLALKGDPRLRSIYTSLRGATD